ncbi:MAG: hypothetical protein H7A23_26355 [Leptospiraceae bacterium]|nr:hypothetical protein [Leptospiraceae bacterium]
MFKLKMMYESFGLAWRLMDDFQDWQKDFQASQISAVYYYLPENLQQEWTECNKSEDDTEISQFIEKESIRFKILKRIMDELKNSIRLANELGFEGMAKEFEFMTHFRGISQTSSWMTSSNP